MRSILGFAVLVLCFGGQTTSGHAPVKGDTIFASVPLARRAHMAGIITKADVGIGIPLDRLSLRDTADPIYTSPACAPLKIIATEPRDLLDDRLFLSDGFYRFRLEGPWQLFTFSQPTECLRASKALQARQGHGAAPFLHGDPDGTIWFHRIPTFDPEELKER